MTNNNIYFWQLRYKVEGVSLFGGPYDVIHANPITSISDILSYGCTEQDRLLGHNANIFPQKFYIVIFNVYPVNKYLFEGNEKNDELYHLCMCELKISSRVYNFNRENKKLLIITVGHL